MYFKSFRFYLTFLSIIFLINFQTSILPGMFDDSSDEKSSGPVTISQSIDLPFIGSSLVEVMLDFGGGSFDFDFKTTVTDDKAKIHIKDFFDMQDYKLHVSKKGGLSLTGKAKIFNQPATLGLKELKSFDRVVIGCTFEDELKVVFGPGGKNSEISIKDIDFVMEKSIVTKTLGLTATEKLDAVQLTTTQEMPVSVMLTTTVNVFGQPVNVKIGRIDGKSRLAFDIYSLKITDLIPQLPNDKNNPVSQIEFRDIHFDVANFMPTFKKNAKSDEGVEATLSGKVLFKTGIKDIDDKYSNGYFKAVLNKNYFRLTLGVNEVPFCKDIKLDNAELVVNINFGKNGEVLKEDTKADEEKKKKEDEAALKKGEKLESKEPKAAEIPVRQKSGITLDAIVSFKDLIKVSSGSIPASMKVGLHISLLNNDKPAKGETAGWVFNLDGRVLFDKFRPFEKSDIEEIKKIEIKEARVGATVSGNEISFYISGIANILDSNLKVRLLVGKVKENVGFLLKAEFSPGWKLSDKIKGLKGSPIEHIILDNAGIVVSMFPEHEEAIGGGDADAKTSGVTITCVKGITFYAGMSFDQPPTSGKDKDGKEIKVDLSKVKGVTQPVDKDGKPIPGAKISQAIIYGSIGLSPKDFKLTAKLPGILKMDAPEQVFKSLNLNFELGLGGIALITEIELQPTEKDERIKLFGRFAFDFIKQEVAFAASMGSGTFSSEDLKTSSKGTWKNVFGVKGLTISNLAVQAKIDLKQSASGIPLSNLGFTGRMKIGNIEAMVAFAFGTKPDDIIVAGELENLTIQDLIALGNDISKGDNNLGVTVPDKNAPNVGIKYLKIYIVPKDKAQIGEFKFEQGYAFEADIILLEQAAKVSIFLSKTGLSGWGWIKPIDFLGMLKITGKGFTGLTAVPGIKELMQGKKFILGGKEQFPDKNDIPSKGAAFYVKLTPAEQLLFITGDVEILGLNGAVDLYLGIDGFYLRTFFKMLELNNGKGWLEAEVEASTFPDKKMYNPSTKLSENSLNELNSFRKKTLYASNNLYAKLSDRKPISQPAPQKSISKASDPVVKSEAARRDPSQVPEWSKAQQKYLKENNISEILTSYVDPNYNKGNLIFMPGAKLDQQIRPIPINSTIVAPIKVKDRASLDTVLIKYGENHDKEAIVKIHSTTEESALFDFFNKPMKHHVDLSVTEASKDKESEVKDIDTKNKITFFTDRHVLNVDVLKQACLNKVRELEDGKAEIIKKTIELIVRIAKQKTIRELKEADANRTAKGRALKVQLEAYIQKSNAKIALLREREFDKIAKEIPLFRNKNIRLLASNSNEPGVSNQEKFKSAEYFEVSDAEIEKIEKDLKEKYGEALAAEIDELKEKARREAINQYTGAVGVKQNVIAPIKLPNTCLEQITVFKENNIKVFKAKIETDVDKVYNEALRRRDENLSKLNNKEKQLAKEAEIEKAKEAEIEKAKEAEAEKSKKSGQSKKVVMSASELIAALNDSSEGCPYNIAQDGDSLAIDPFEFIQKSKKQKSSDKKHLLAANTLGEDLLTPKKVESLNKKGTFASTPDKDFYLKARLSMGTLYELINEAIPNEVLKLKGEIDKGKNEVDKLNIEIARLDGEIDSLEKLIYKLIEDKAGAQAAKNRKQQDDWFGKANRDLENARNEVNSLQNQINQVNAGINAAQEKVNSILNEINYWNNIADHLQWWEGFRWLGIKAYVGLCWIGYGTATAALAVAKGVGTGALEAAKWTANQALNLAQGFLNGVMREINDLTGVIGLKSKEISDKQNELTAKRQARNGLRFVVHAADDALDLAKWGIQTASDVTKFAVMLADPTKGAVSIKVNKASFEGYLSQLHLGILPHVSIDLDMGFLGSKRNVVLDVQLDLRQDKIAASISNIAGQLFVAFFK